MNKKEIDITENIAAGDIDHILSILKRYREIGYDKLYWDGYDSAIYLYKSSQPERSKREDYPSGSLWKNTNSFDKTDETYEFYGMFKGNWIFLGRFRHFTEIQWDRCGALNIEETQ